METPQASPSGSSSLICGQCGESFPNMNQWNIHLRIHQGKAILACQYCGRNCLNEYQLRKHEEIHTTSEPFKCDDCGRRFAESSQLKHHMKTHAKCQYKCEECGKSYTTRFYLKEHAVVHTGEKPFKCDQCGKDFATPSKLKNHKSQAHREKPFKCKDCGESFNVALLLEKHRALHTGVKPFQCDQCEEAFLSKKELNRHASRHFKPFTCDDCGTGFFLSTSLKLHQETLANEDPYICDQCGKDFKTKDCFQKHKCSPIEKKTSEQRDEDFTEQNGESFAKCKQNIYQEMFETAQLKADKIEDVTNKGTTEENPEIKEKPPELASVIHTQTKSFRCNQCDISFSTKAELQKHGIIHSSSLKKKNSKPFTCADCGSGFFESYSLKLHLRNNDKGPHCCERCAKIFQSQECFQKHKCSPVVKKIAPPPVPVKQPEEPHVPPTLFKCDHCDKVFKNKRQLQRHAPLHIKPYICEFCCKSFKKPSMLTEHVRVHTGEKPFVCPKCGLGFISKHSLKVHMKTNVGERVFASVKCGKDSKTLKMKCGKAFPAKNGLKRHESAHAKPLTCKYCDKSFKNVGVFMRHIKFHCGASHKCKGFNRRDRCVKSSEGKERFQGQRKNKSDFRSQQTQTNVSQEAVETCIKIKEEPHSSEEDEDKPINANDTDLKEQFDGTIIKVEIDDHGQTFDESAVVKEELCRTDDGEHKQALVI